MSRGQRGLFSLNRRKERRWPGSQAEAVLKASSWKMFSADNLSPRQNFDELCRSFVLQRRAAQWFVLISAFDHRVGTEITAERLIGCNSRLPRSCRIRNPTSAVDHFFFPLTTTPSFSQSRKSEKNPDLFAQGLVPLANSRNICQFLSYLVFLFLQEIRQSVPESRRYFLRITERMLPWIGNENQRSCLHFNRQVSFCLLMNIRPILPSGRNLKIPRGRRRNHGGIACTAVYHFCYPIHDRNANNLERAMMDDASLNVLTISRHHQLERILRTQAWQ